MKTNITKTSHVNGTITFSKEEKEIIQKVYSMIAHISELMNEIEHNKDNFEGNLNYGKSGTGELFNLEEFLYTLESLKDLESIDYEYDDL